MKKAIFILFLFIPIVINATNYYVATNGNDNNPGTITQPFASWQYAFNKLIAGDILYVRGGTYTIMGSANNGVYVSGKNGSASNWITVLGYPGEASPVLNCAGLTASSGEHVGLKMANCSYWSISNLEIINVPETGAPGPGCQVESSHHITYTNITVHDCHNGFLAHTGCNEIRYINCDSYRNADHFNNGDLCNGFWAKLNGNGSIYYEGCRAWMNSDDGWDFYAAPGYGNGYIYINNCWAFNNGPWLPDGSDNQGNGSGFKLGANDMPALNGVQRKITNSLSINNKGYGIDESQDSWTSIINHIYNNVISGNECGLNFMYSGVADVIRNNVTYNNTRLQETPYGGNTVDHNSWQIATVTSSDFVSLDAEQLKGTRKSDGSLPDITAFHLTAGSVLNENGVDVGLPFSGKAPDLGTFEVQSGSITPAVIPQFVSAVIENATPSLLVITYNLSLNNLIVPAISSFNILVNSVARNVTLASISGNKVQLTLASAAKQGDLISVSYTKPVSNPIQTATGGAAENIIAKSVTNNLISSVPVYSSSVIENATPSLLEITFSLSLANIVPSNSAFNIQVNSVTRIVNSIAISGNKVQLTLANPIKSGDIVTVSYSKPAINPLQTSDGGQTSNISAQISVNKITTSNTTSNIKMTVYPNPVHQIINILFEYTSSYSIQDASKSPQIIRIFDLSGKLYVEKILGAGVAKILIPINLKPGLYIVLMISNGLQMSSQKIIVY